MRHNIYSLFLAGAAVLALAGCEKEAAFWFNPDEGQLNCGNLSVNYVNSETRASNIDTGEFEVNFVNTKTGEVAQSYKYGEMPEIISLPVGEYQAEAVYGEDVVAAWDNPLYEGSSSFSIEAGKLTDDVDPIECTLQNIKVEVDLVDETGMDIIGEDVQVVVSAGKKGQLTYDAEHIDSVGFFQFDGSKTIIAELSGTLDGYKTEEGNGITRIYENAAAGKAYRIRFHINRPDNVHDGDIQLGDGIKVDATIHIKDENHVINPNEPADDILVDDMRPVESTDDDPDKKDPNEKDPNDDPKPEKNAPTISPTSEGLQLGVCYDVAEGSSVAFTVTSETGITEFTINIDSTTLTKDELEDVGLSADLDLVNPGEFEEPLTNLGFPTGDAVRGKTECSFDISGFVPMLMMLGQGEHKFNITVSDENGTSTGTIWLRNEGE